MVNWLREESLCRTKIVDFGDLIIMPGLVDSHVHINDPGRSEWEGFATATKAAAAGGFTTIADMPLNSIPPTTTVENLRAKTNVAHGKVYVDVAFWGGLIPGNASSLMPLVQNGVIGFKCFLCPSGVPEFPHVNEEQVEEAFKILEGTESLLAFHAELECGSHGMSIMEENPKKYSTYLHSRPSIMEKKAIDMVTRLSAKYNVRTHIVHLSSADPLPVIKEARMNGARLTLETCHHYLTLSAEEIPDAHTEYKCSPPIRTAENRMKLWEAIKARDIDMIVSDHSPSTPGIKLLTYGKSRGDFMRAWGGISSVQFGLSLFWTHCQSHELTLNDLHRLLCQEPAKLLGIDSWKGRIAVGYDADFCVWDPDASFAITSDIIHFQNKANPYMGKVVRGKVHATVLRGLIVFKEDEPFANPMGKLILRKKTKRAVQFH
ncbi:allantoinase isoform X2 [Phlebotomus papatasi]|uniref:allantoinase isoform X2 n=1 Tax=Phlebotomus papatasi TaxID=29031 RepID=UPI0024841EE2|nr:allantoinase isoform X2 [Phlebotomus papatasi]